MKSILVTGSTGFYGQEIVHQLLNKEDYYVIAVRGRHKDVSWGTEEHPRLMWCGMDDFFNGSLPELDTVVNCAFSRSNDCALLVQSLDFTERLIVRLKEIGVKSTINVSSQGVYQRLPVGKLSHEGSPILPIDLYSMTKYATEKMFLSSSLPNVTNVRLGSLMMPQRFLYFFVQKAIKEEKFILTAPYQYAALLDVKDAALGLVGIVGLNEDKRAKTYNLGIGTQYSLLQYAESVKEIGERLGFRVDFDVSDNGTVTCSGMDNTRIVEDTGWKPRIMKDEMIFDLFNSLA